MFTGPGTRAGRGKALKAIFSKIADGTILANFAGRSARPTATTPDAALIQRVYYAASTSGTTTYTATLSPVPTAYVTGATYAVTVSNTNTGAVTMNFNGLGAKTVQWNGAALTANLLVAGHTYQMVYDGTNLQVVVGVLGSSGGYTRLAQVITSSSASTITFSSIPGIYSDLEIRFLGRATGAVATIGVAIRMNGDTSGHHKGQSLAGSSGSATSASIGGTSSGVTAFNISGTSAATDPITGATISIPGYAVAVNHAWTTTFYTVNGAADIGQVGVFGGSWWGAAAITQIELIIASGSFLDGAVATLYGIG